MVKSASLALGIFHPFDQRHGGGRHAHLRLVDEIDERVARLLLRIDLFNGASAAALLIAGLARLNFGAKGWDYYEAQQFFWAKMAAFALIGLISIMPTLSYFRWVKAASKDAALVVADADVKKVRRLVMVELHVLALLLAFAALMARGIGG